MTRPRFPEKSCTDRWRCNISESATPKGQPGSGVSLESVSLLFTVAMDITKRRLKNSLENGMRAVAVLQHYRKRTGTNSSRCCLYKCGVHVVVALINSRSWYLNI